MDLPSGRTPHVSVVTPVFNGERYLRQCIDSVIAQTYPNWTYTLVDNCSTDGTWAILQEAMTRDSRIRAVRGSSFVGAIENHNRAFAQLSAESEYCKLLSADDWLLPGFLDTLVELGERHRAAAVISCYVANKVGIPFPGFPLEEEFFDGRSVAVDFLRGKLKRFWLPTSTLYRASFVRARASFYPGSSPSADLEACLECLASGDLAFAHQVLAFERLHDATITADVANLNSTITDRLRVLQVYGPRHLGQAEYKSALGRLLWHYYKDVLAEGAFAFRGPQFWRVHRQGLAAIGRSIADWRFALGIISVAADVLLNPLRSSRRVVRRLLKIRRS